MSGCKGMLLGAVSLLAGTGSLVLAGAGKGFGESLWPLMSARQAGCGGLALDDLWRQGEVVEANTVILDPGLRWYGIGYQGGLGPGVRMGAEVFLFNAPEIGRTVENADGTFGGQAGTFSAVEWGGRLLGQVDMWNGGGYRLAALGRASGLLQQIPGSRNGGASMEIGAQMMRELGERQMLAGWVLTGPYGRGAGRAYANQVLVGAGFKNQRRRGFLRGAEGYAFGAEAQMMSEGLVHGGGGGTYWLGDPDGAGITLLLSAGVRLESGSAQYLQPRGGMGILWRKSGGWGVQFDYAIAPIGEPGMYHYGSISLRLPASVPSEESRLPRDSGELSIPENVPKEDFIITFYPDNGEKGRAPIQAEAPTILGASLLDGEGGFIKYLIDAHAVGPGEYVVEWDGKLDLERMADYDKPYLIRITLGNQTRYIKMIARKAGE